MIRLVALVVACATTAVMAQQPSPGTIAPAPDTALPAANTPQPTPDMRPAFADWLEGVRAEAIAGGIRPAVVQEALSEVTEPVPVVIERDRSQTETVLSIESYLARQLTAERVRTGREMMAKFAGPLNEVARRYGVPSSIVGGIWGMESNFGRFSGVRPTIAALATLAWDPRRGSYFRRELMDALRILDNGDVDLAQLKGSWAGAMGQPQFMPSSYLQFAADFDGDGHRDIWSTPVDVFASIANYLKGHGWTADESWGREVRLAPEAASRVAAAVARRAGSCSALRDMTIALPVTEWRRFGVRTVGGGSLPQDARLASLVSGTSRHFLVYGNYDALLQYNCAHSYALSVALLGDRLSARGVTAGPTRRTTAPQDRSTPLDRQPPRRR